MNKDILQGEWKLLKGKLKEKWGKLTDDDLTEINGKKDQLLGKLQKRYGLTKEKALETYNEWEKSFSDNSLDKSHATHQPSSTKFYKDLGPK